MAKPVGHRSSDYASPRPAPPGSKPTARVEPFSPWQLLIEDRRVELDPPLSLDDLSLASKIPKASIFNWLRHPEGAPPRKRYTATLNARLAKALQITPDALATAYDASRTKFSPRAPEPQAQALSRFLGHLRASRKSSWTTASLLKLGDDFLDGRR